MLARLICLLSCCFSFLINAEQELKLTIYTEHFPPYNFISDGQLVGINVELTQRVCRHAKINCKYELLPWSRAYFLAQSQANSGLISTSRYAAREDKFTWVGPIAYSDAYLYKLAERTDIALDKMADARQYTIGMQRNDVYEQVLLSNGFEKGKNLLELSYKHEEVKLFFSGKLDFIIGSPLTLPYQVAAAGYSIELIKPAIKLPIEGLQGNYLALNPGYPRELADRLQQSLEELKKDGTVEAIIAKYKK